MNIFRGIKKSVYITSVLAIVVGIIFLVNPVGAINFIAKMIGAVVMLAGIINVISYIRQKNDGFRMATTLMIGVILIAVGAFLVIYSGVTLTLLGFVVAIYITLDGVISVDSSIAMARSHVKGWAIHLILAVLLTLGGIYLLLHPFDAVGASASIFGVILLLDGIYGLLTAMRLHLSMREVVNEVKKVVDPEIVADVEDKE